MTYHLTINNGYSRDVSVEGTTVTANGGTWTSPNLLGSTIVTVPGLGEISFLDVGDDKGVGGFCQETWGVLISYQGNEAVFRYEGSGQVSAALNEYGQVTLTSNGCVSYPQLSSFTGE